MWLSVNDCLFPHTGLNLSWVWNNRMLGTVKFKMKMSSGSCRHLLLSTHQSCTLVTLLSMRLCHLTYTRISTPYIPFTPVKSPGCHLPKEWNRIVCLILLISFPQTISYNLWTGMILKPLTFINLFSLYKGNLVLTLEPSGVIGDVAAMSERLNVNREVHYTITTSVWNREDPISS